MRYGATRGRELWFTYTIKQMSPKDYPKEKIPGDKTFGIKLLKVRP